MRRLMRHLWFVAFLLALSSGTVNPLWADDDDDLGYVSDQVIVKLQPGVAIGTINADYGTTTVDNSLSGRRIFLLRTTEDPTQIVSDMQSDARVLFAELNFYSSVPEANPRGSYAWGGQDTAPLVGQYAADLINLATAQQFTLGNGTTVAVIDTGVQLDHPYLVDRLVAGYDFVNNDAQPADVASGSDADGDGRLDEAFGHGTHVAGIVRNVAPAAALMPLRVLNSDGIGTSFNVARAINWATVNAADIINLSLGSPAPSLAVAELTTAADAQGVVIVAAAGNRNSEDQQFPAALPAVLAVTSVDAQRQKAPDASFGEWVDVAAPGEGIYSSYPTDGYAWWSGTSMATPFVSGLAALVVSSGGARSSSAISDLIRQNATSLDGDNPNYEGKLGHGLIDAGQTVQSLYPPTAVTLAQTPRAAGPQAANVLLAALLAAVTGAAWSRRAV